MKPVIVFCIACFSVVQALAQQTNGPIVEAYAYHQPSLRGARPTATAGEAGNEKRTTQTITGNLYIYITYEPSQNIVPFRIWIDGKPHRVTYELVQRTPVVITRPGIGTSTLADTLVPATSNKLVQVRRGAALTRLTIPPLEKAKADAVAGKIVIEYYWRARRYACTIPEIKILEAVPLQ